MHIIHASNVLQSKSYTYLSSVCVILILRCCAQDTDFWLPPKIVKLLIFFMEEPKGTGGSSYFVYSFPSGEARNWWCNLCPQILTPPLPQLCSWYPFFFSWYLGQHLAWENFLRSSLQVSHRASSHVLVLVQTRLL